MLKALYDYGVRRQLALPPGFAGKTMKAYISLSESDDHVSVYLGGNEPVPCPDIGSLANGKDKSNVLAEKRSVVIPEEPGSKSTFFLEALRSAAEEEPLLKVCVRALETPELAAAVRAELDRAKIKPGDRISFRVNGQSILQSEKLRTWWKSYRKQFSAADERPSTLCLITGEPTVPMTTTTPIQGLRVVGGHASGDALICFDKTAFCSYNQKKAANAPVSEEAFSVVKAALDDLLKDAPILAGMKFVHWFDREIPQEDDPLYTVDFGYDLPEDETDEEAEPEAAVNELTARNQANQIPESVYSGQPVPDLDNVSYYILLLSGANSRVMIRRYDRGSYPDLRRNLRRLLLSAKEVITSDALIFYTQKRRKRRRYGMNSYNIGLEDRKIIEEMYNAGAKPCEIAARIGKCQATIYREIKRGEVPELNARCRPAYRAEVAEKRVTEAYRKRGRRKATE